MSKIILKESQLREMVENAIISYLNESEEIDNMLNEDDIDEWGDAAKAFFRPIGKKIGEKGKEAYNNMANKASSAYNAVASRARDFRDGVTDTFDAAKENYRNQKNATAAMNAAKDGEKQMNNAINILKNLKDKGVITSPGAIQALNKLELCLKMQNKRRYQHAGNLQKLVK